MQTENKKGFQVKDLIVTALLSLCALVILYSLCVSVFFSVHDVSGKPIVGTTSCYYLLSCSSQN